MPAPLYLYSAGPNSPEFAGLGVSEPSLPPLRKNSRVRAEFRFAKFGRLSC